MSLIKFRIMFELKLFVNFPGWYICLLIGQKAQNVMGIMEKGIWGEAGEDLRWKVVQSILNALKQSRK